MQLSIDFITDESRTLAKTLQQTKAYNDELEASTAKIKKYQNELKGVANDEAKRTAILEKISLEEQKIADNLKKIAAEGKKVEAIDLTKIAPAQLTQRAKQLEQALRLIPTSAPEYRVLAAELKTVNDRIAVIRSETKGVAAGMKEAGVQTGFWQRALAGAVGVFGGLSLDNILSGLLNFGTKLFDIGTGLDALNNKTQTVFGKAEGVVRGFAETNARSLGLAQQEYINLATNAGDLLKPMGFAEDAVANLSVALTDQAGVLSEWTGGRISTTEASQVLTKALLGERDALNSLGIDIKDSLVQDELKKRGLQDLTGESRRQAEALVTLDLITRQSTSANEAFAKGTDSAVRAKAELRARIAEITQGLAKFFIPIFNTALSVIIPVVDWVGRFGARLVEAYQKADTFRGIVTGVFNTIGAVISNVAQGIANISEGFLNLFEGNFSAALDSFKGAFDKLNPFAIGSEVKNAFVAGLNSKKVDLVPAGEDKKAEKEGNKVGAAFANGFDAQFEALKKSGQRGGEALAKAAKDALDLRLKEIEAAYLKEELVAEVQRQKGQLNESNFGRQILILKKEQYKQQIEAFKRFNQEESKEAIAAQKNLLEVQQQLKTGGVAPLAPLATVQPGQVTSQTAPLLRQGEVAAADNEIQIVKDKLARIVDLENESEILRLEMKRNALNEQLELLRAAGIQETTAFQQILDEKIKADDEYNEKILSNADRTSDFRDEIEKKSWEAQKELFDATIDLLSRDENARKKNSAVIKALQIAQIQLDAIREIQGIWASVSNIPPPAGQILGGVLTAAAVIRSIAAVSKVRNTKFATGGLARFGFFGGKPHAAGGTKGYFEDGTAIEVEKDEAFAVVNKRNAPLLRALSAINSAGGHGVPYFEKGGIPKFAFGGLPTVNTTPTGVASPTAAAQPLLGNMTDFIGAVNDFRQIVRTFPREVKSRVVYTELRDTAAEVATVEADASI